MIARAVAELFERIVLLEPPDRDAALRAADAEVAAEVGSLLKSLECSPDFLESTTLDCGPRGAEEDLAGNRGKLDMGRVGPGSRLGAYTIVREVGRGGMGIVYEAEQDQPRRRVALKVVRPGPFQRYELARFRREAEVLGRLNHPGIAMVLEAKTPRMEPGTEEHCPYIAMEFVDGEPINTHVQRMGLSVEKICALVVEACDALQHAHEQGVIHRDLSPSNILVDRSGRIKIVDFGVARLLQGSAGVGATLATVGPQVMGKWAYMAPEQAGRPGDGADHRADVFSLGAVLYELVTGRTWIETSRRSILELMRAIQQDSVPPVVRLVGRRGRDLDAIIGLAMRKETGERYPSAAEMGADLKRWIDGRPVMARAPSAMMRARESARRHPGLWAGSVGTLLALMIGLAATSTQALRAYRAERGTSSTLYEVLSGVVAGLERNRAGLRSRAAILERIRPSIESMEPSIGDDPQARLIVARYYLELAKVVGYPYTPNLGRVDEAIVLLDQAMAVAAPEGLDRQRNEALALEASRALLHKALTITAFNRRTPMLNELRMLGTMASRWSERSANFEEWETLSASVMFATVQALNLEGRRAESDSLIGRARDRVDRLERSGASPMLTGPLWNSLYRAEREHGTLEASLESCGRAKAAFAREPVQEGPVLQHIGDAWRYTGMNLRDLGRLAEAEAAMTRAYENYTRSEQVEHDRADLMGIRALVLGERAYVRSLLGDPAAITDVSESIAIRRARVMEDPDMPSARLRLVESLARMASVVDALVERGTAPAVIDGEAIEVVRYRCLSEASSLLIGG